MTAKQSNDGNGAHTPQPPDRIERVCVGTRGAAEVVAYGTAIKIIG